MKFEVSAFPNRLVLSLGCSSAVSAHTKNNCHNSIQRTQLPLPWPESARASTSVVCFVSFNRSGCKARAQETGASSHFLSTRARALDNWLRALHNLRSRRGVAGLRAGLGSLPDLASDPNSAVGPLCDLELVTSLL